MANLRNYKGTRDWFGQEARWRNFLIGRISSIFEQYGFEPLETPAIETIQTLVGKYGEEGEMNMFKLSARGRTTATQGGLRYDHTVPLARFVAMKWNEVQFPFKRYAIGPVFRNEKTQAGRFKQFTQCDFDTIGSTSLLVDSEVPAINYNVLTSLGFPEGSFSVAVNDRRLLNAMVASLGVTKRKLVKAFFRSWDKLGKATRPQINAELKRAGADSEQISRFNIITDQMLEVRDSSNDDILKTIAKLFNGSDIKTAVEIIDTMLNYVSSMGVPDWAFRFNPLLARGLAYYTGPIFETSADGGLGAITGGGRFDQLIERLGGPDTPASGSSFGLERVMEVMVKKGLQQSEQGNADVFVSIFDQNDTDLVFKSFQIASAIRLTGARVDVYTGEQVGLKKQLRVASRKNIPVSIILGPDEDNKGQVAVKDMFATKLRGKQYTVSQNQVTDFVKKLLS